MTEGEKIFKDWYIKHFVNMPPFEKLTLKDKESLSKTLSFRKYALILEQNRLINTLVLVAKNIVDQKQKIIYLILLITYILTLFLKKSS